MIDLFLASGIIFCFVCICTVSHRLSGNSCDY